MADTFDLLDMRRSIVLWLCDIPCLLPVKETLPQDLYLFWRDAFRPMGNMIECVRFP